jgi:hypothetical protein
LAEFAPVYDPDDGIRAIELMFASIGLVSYKVPEWISPKLMGFSSE